MDTRNISTFLQKSIVTAGVGVVCGAIGAVEGAISGATGAAILNAAGHGESSIATIAIAASAGIGLLGALEGLALGGLAVNGFFGTAQDMEKNGYKNIDKRILGYVGYTTNQIVGGMLAALLLIIANSAISFVEMTGSVAVGAAITGIVITPIVTALAVLLLAGAYAMTKTEDAPTSIARNSV